MNTEAKKDELADALGTDEKSSLKAAKKAAKKPSKGKVLKGDDAKAALKASGDKKTKVKGVDDKPKAKDKKSKDKGKAKSKDKPKAKSKANGSNRGVRHGQHTAAIEEASKAILKLKKGDSFTTRECKDRFPKGPAGWAFREAAKRLAVDKEVKLKNSDRVNTITRL